ncbi:MAG: hypothetical protein HS104_09960 [Polyangiaceae bacterium]|nr:hypothetical protein [Polyangiaceae bacterium]MCE7890034.1 hypothetical protein [Sorangiineae bacterium PRO1]MCL4750865.1 hypothetical protein [Myxococcales bacterium]
MRARFVGMSPVKSCLKLGLLTSFLGLGGCGAAPRAALEAPAPSAAASPRPVLERSLFSRDSTGSVSEDDLQKVLAARVEITLPARIGVVALDTAFDPEKRAPVTEQAIVAKSLTRTLKGSPHVSAVTDVSTELPNPSGIEGLRAIAARYRTRYLMLVNTITEDRSHLNNWAWLYATGLGVFLAPGQTVSTEGLLEASLFDVKTGTVLYTVREPFQTSKVTWLIGAGRTQASEDGQAIAQAAQRLGKKVLGETEELSRWVKDNDGNIEKTSTASLAERR